MNGRWLYKIRLWWNPEYLYRYGVAELGKTSTPMEAVSKIIEQREILHRLIKIFPDKAKNAITGKIADDMICRIARLAAHHSCTLLETHSLGQIQELECYILLGANYEMR